MLKNIKRSLQEKKEESIETEEVGKRVIEEVERAITKTRLAGMIDDIRYLNKGRTVVIKTKTKIAANELLFNKESLEEQLKKQVKIRIL